MDVSWVELYPYVGSFLATLADATVKTFQTRNISTGNEWAAMWTSYLVTLTWGANIGFFLAGGWAVIASAAVGGSIGVVIAMRIHKRLFQKGKFHGKENRDLQRA